MAYFETFPQIAYDIHGERLLRNKVISNILARVKFIDTVKDNTYLYYRYDIQDGDTPEIIAAKYYDNPNRHWIVMMANDIIDPVYDWPLSLKNFENMLINKYGSIENSKNTTHHYEKIITKTDSVTTTTTVKKLEIDQNTYNSLAETTTQTVNLTSGSVTIITTKNAVSNYDYENDLNESKRTIKIIDKKYINQIEAELRGVLTLNV